MRGEVFGCSAVAPGSSSDTCKMGLWVKITAQIETDKKKPAVFSAQKSSAAFSILLKLVLFMRLLRQLSRCGSDLSESLKMQSSYRQTDLQRN